MVLLLEASGTFKRWDLVEGSYVTGGMSFLFSCPRDRSGCVGCDGCLLFTPQLRGSSSPHLTPGHDEAAHHWHRGRPWGRLLVTETCKALSRNRPLLLEVTLSGIFHGNRKPADAEPVSLAVGKGMGTRNCADTWDRIQTTHRTLPKPELIRRPPQPGPLGRLHSQKRK